MLWWCSFFKYLGCIVWKLLMALPLSPFFTDMEAMKMSMDSHQMHEIWLTYLLFWKHPHAKTAHIVTIHIGHLGKKYMLILPIVDYVPLIWMKSYPIVTIMFLIRNVNLLICESRLWIYCWSTFTNCVSKDWVDQKNAGKPGHCGLVSFAGFIIQYPTRHNHVTATCM